MIADATLCGAVRTYVELLLRWNQRISLTAVTDPDKILRFHFGESMFAASAVPIGVGRLADVGSGGGFPGLPIKMVVPSISAVLIEANTKKAAFLAEVARELNLNDVEIARTRVESLPDSAGLLDFVTARALGGYQELLRWSKTRLGEGGRVALWLGSDEIRFLRAERGWRWRDPLAIPGANRRGLLVGWPESHPE
ncbi:MAG TPA: 16S rRNA (guanine(527)-N(7))-methyltransferase RsmG [Candidatus Acidoferrales bacterium]|nr:16S rRNA (guanine(527)-N(7))-methyltransferase RsmG [Candidatus Acidoferrales bacterium]